LDLAIKLEEAALKDDYFIKRKLYPNVDFYTGIIYNVFFFFTFLNLDRPLVSPRICSL